ncbi:transposase [Arsenophonus endosymbiont of Bemisia tabaci]|uniref:transposase n=1 Tax=Arsenophonus endosymbiont of Bemisia tabaci TaxID=536059 RepID=UPI00175BDE7F|nr:transposase [Arsenophonus endosymbiont of Bemisia tabaci]CAA2929066.1 hypothetical protein ARSQ2_00130 [Arsenophonus endosymbiont of Bemisia tabaci Q2]
MEKNIYFVIKIKTLSYIQQVIIDAGHMVEYLPTYSPHLNPIEHKWAQAKCKKRSLGCDTDILFALNMV